MTDARFEDAAQGPLRLQALSAEDLPVMSALIQDAVLHVSDISWMRRHRRTALILNRFRWEDAGSAQQSGRAFERVRSVLMIENVLRMTADGVDPQDKETILSVLALSFEPGTDAAGRLVLTLAGDGALAFDVECLDVSLTDVTRPYIAPTGHQPSHPED